MCILRGPTSATYMYLSAQLDLQFGTTWRRTSDGRTYRTAVVSERRQKYIFIWEFLPYTVLGEFPPSSYRLAQPAPWYLRMPHQCSVCYFRLRVDALDKDARSEACNIKNYTFNSMYTGWTKKQVTAKWSKIVLKPVNEIRFIRQIKVWIKHNNIIRWN